MNDHVVKTHWFKLTVKSTAIVNELVTYLATVVPKYYWGTLCVELSSDQVSQIHTMFPEKIKVTEIHACCTDVVIESIWDHPTEVYAAALKQTQLDYEQIDEAFKSDFEYLFKTNKDGSLIFRKDTHLEVSLFAVKYAHKIQSLSGLPCIVPRYSRHTDQLFHVVC